MELHVQGEQLLLAIEGLAVLVGDERTLLVK